MKITAPKHYRGDNIQEVEPTIVVTSTTGVRFRARLLRKGDAYGLDDRLTWEHEKPGVEFYDTRFPHTPRGQFVSRYFADTFLEGSAGIDLDGGIDNWEIDAEATYAVRIWLWLEIDRVLVQPEEVPA